MVRRNRSILPVGAGLPEVLAVATVAIFGVVVNLGLLAGGVWVIVTVLRALGVLS